jgi:hypothetical protein
MGSSSRRRINRSARPQSKKWLTKTATASAIADAIADHLDFEEHLDTPTLELIADTMANAFDFTTKRKRNSFKRRW